MNRGALYCLLKNRLYLGETVHKGTPYPGEHKAIVSVSLFDAVQERFATVRRRQMGKRSSSQDAPLAGLLFDELGSPMTPTYSIKPGGRRYRYYVSQTTLKGEPSTASISRVPATPLEDLVSRSLLGLRLPSLAATHAPGGVLLLNKVELKKASIVMNLARQPTIDAWRSWDASDLDDHDLVTRHRGYLNNDEHLSEDEGHLVLTLPMRARFRGGRAGLLHPKGEPVRSSGPDAALIKAIAKAHRWKEMLLSGEVASVEALAAKVKQERRHVGRTLGLSFLSPDITRSILRGEQPAGLRLAQLLDTNLPLSWREQARLIERLSTLSG